MDTMDKLEALRTLARRNYSTWTRKALIDNWKIIGDFKLTGYCSKASLIELTVKQEIKGNITEPAPTEGWKNQVDYWLDLLINEMDFDEKVELIVSAISAREWREAL